MKTKIPALFLVVWLLISLSCTCPGSGALEEVSSIIPGIDAGSGGVQDQNPLGSSTRSKNAKTPQGELVIRDQWFMQTGDLSRPLVSIAVLIENTDTEQAVVDWDLQFNFYDEAGSPIILDTGLEGGKLPTQESVIFPGSQYLFCTNLSGEANKAAARFDVTLDPKTPGVTLALNQNPLSITSHLFLPVSEYDNAIGTVRAVIQNTNPVDVVVPQTTAALFDGSGKLSGCGHSVNSPMFVPGGGQAISEFAVFSSEQPASTKAFVSMLDLTGSDYYLPVEPLAVSGAAVTKVGDYLVPAFTLSPTTDKAEILSFYVNVTAVDAQGGVVWTDSFVRESFIKPGQTLGPYFYNPVPVDPGVQPASLQVAVHTNYSYDREGIEPALTIGSSTYDPSSQTIQVQVTNPASDYVQAGIYAACFDAAQQITALGSAAEIVQAGGAAAVSIYTPPLTGDGCANAEIRVSLSNIN